jgi:hypothetical protein
LSRRDFDVFRFGTAMADGVYPRPPQSTFPPAEIAAQPMISAD